MSILSNPYFNKYLTNSYVFKVKCKTLEHIIKSKTKIAPDPIVLIFIEHLKTEMKIKLNNK